MSCDKLLTCGIRCLLVVLWVSVVSFGQDTKEPATPDEAAREEAVEGLLPLLDYTGDWKTRQFLSGDWGGTRTKWAKKGVTLDVHWLNVAQGIVNGGVDTGWGFATSLDVYAKFDLMRMGVLPGALISFRAQSRFGTTVNADTGLLLPVNSYQYFPFTAEVDENVPFAITELNWTQFVSEKLGFMLGKITTMNNANEFAGGEGRTQFMNFQFIYSAVFAQMVGYSTPAAGVIWQPTPKLVVLSILMNTKDASTTIGLGDIGDGTSWWTELNYQYKAGGLPGGGTVGFIYGFDGDFTRIGGINIDPGGGISLETKSEAWAGYFSGWQYLYVRGEAPEVIDARDNRQDLEGFGLFLIVGVADRSTNPATFTVAGGFSGRGMIPGRGDDTYGLGYFYNDLQDLRALPILPLGSSTQGLEAYYNLAIARSIALTFDFQWARSAIRNIADAIIVGARLNIRF